MNIHNEKINHEIIKNSKKQSSTKTYDNSKISYNYDDNTELEKNYKSKLKKHNNTKFKKNYNTKFTRNHIARDNFKKKGDFFRKNTSDNNRSYLKKNIYNRTFRNKTFRTFFSFFAPSLIVLAIIIGVVLHPVDSIGSAKEGFKIWVDILIPSLLPFIIGANLLIDLKLVDIIGYIINPITKFLFNVSGQSALIFMISIFSGYPVGAKLASEFRSENKMSKTEAQRLVAFCSTSGPLFIIGSVGTGMFKSALLGYVMLACHYLGAIVVGILYRNYGWETVHKKNSCSILENIKFIISDIKSVVFSKEKRETFFVLFGNAVFKGINTILMVGGFVIIFSVVFKILSIFKVIDLIAIIIYAPLKFLGVSMELCKAFISGLFEITIGCNKISMSTNDSLYIKSVLAVFLIGFSGISILAQCCTFLAKTDIDIKHYIRCKFLHGLFSASILFAIYPSIIGNKIIEGRIGSKIIESENGITTANFLANNKIMLHYMNNYNLILIAVGIIYISTLIYKIVKLNSKNRLNLK